MRVLPASNSVPPLTRISGPSSRGYSSGNGLLTALGLGWIIGEHLAGSLTRS